MQKSGAKFRFPPGEAVRGPSSSSTALDPEPTAQTDPEETFLAAPAGGRGDAEAVIRGGLLVMLTISSREFVEQRLCLFQVGGFEPLSEPAVERREQCVRFVAAPVVAAKPGEAGRGAQFEQPAVLALSERYAVAIAGLRCHAVASLSKQIASQTKGLG